MMRVLSTLKHFRYEQNRISLTVMHGKHCAYDCKVEEAGESVFGKLIYKSIERILS